MYLDTQKIKAGAEAPVTQLPPSQANFMDCPERQSVAATFLKKYDIIHLNVNLFIPHRYFEAFDGDRNLLTGVYSDYSCFSIATQATVLFSIYT